MKLLVIATALAALSMPSLQATAQEKSINPAGPQPYHAVDPVYAPMKPETLAPSAAYVPPSLFLKGDEAHGSAAGPQPYAAPDPVYR